MSIAQRLSQASPSKLNKVLGKAIRFPVTRTPWGGVATVEGNETLEQAIRMELDIFPLEQLYHRDGGIGIAAEIHEDDHPDSLKALAHLAQRKLLQAVQRLRSCEVTAEKGIEQGVVVFRIAYEPMTYAIRGNETQRGNLTHAVSTGGTS